jgi:hypothetical protein
VTPDLALSTSDALTSAVSKVKRHALPLFLIMSIANYMDRVNIGFGLLRSSRQLSRFSRRTG